MKTYKRKRKVHQEIYGVLDMCRLCLTRVDEGVPIFRDSKDICAAIAMRIMICVGLEISYDDTLPNMVCTSCYEELEKYYKFRKKCEMSYHNLKFHQLALKAKEQKYQLQTEISIKEDILEQPEDKVEHNDFKEETPEEKQPINESIDHREYDVVEKSLEDMQPMKEDSNVDNVEVPITNSFVPHENIVNCDIVEKRPEDTHSQQEGRQFGNFVEVPEQSDEKDTEVNTGNVIATEKVVEMEEVQIPMQSESKHDIGTFLRNILEELGILTMQGNELVLQDQGITSFELETGSDEQLMMELVEEDDDGEPGMMKIVDVQREMGTYSQVTQNSEEKFVFIDTRPKQSSKAVKPAGPWCGVCGRAFSSAGAAARHARVHSAARPHACRLCPATFKQKAVRDRHILIHLDVRPHACSWCHKSFTQRAALAAHVRSHAAPPARPLQLHRCTSCDKVFLYASGLSRHMKTHSGRVYECSACDKQFKDRSSMQRHLKNVSHKNLTSSES